MAMGPFPPWRATLTAVLALVDGSYMTIDSIHRFVFGDFIRIGGQLGLWSGIVSAVGVDPLAIGPVFLVLGIASTSSAIALLAQRRWARPLVMVLAVATRWYLVFGTISSLIQLALLGTSRPAKP